MTTASTADNDLLVDHWHQHNGYGVTVTCPSEQLRARVRIDAYARQSHAVAERFTSVGWVEVVRRTPSDGAGGRTTTGAYGCPSYADPDQEWQRMCVRSLAHFLLADARKVVAA